MTEDRPVALLIIDVQQGAFAPDQPPLHEGDGVLGRIASLLSRARDQAIPIVYTQFDGPPGSTLAAGTPPARIHDAVRPHPHDLVIHKSDSDAFLGTDLHEQLVARNIGELVVCGIQSEFCVDATCRTAYGLGYRVVLVRDAHTTADSPSLRATQIIDHHNRTLTTPYVSLRLAADVFR